ncbi:hypothetical protein DWW20_20545 [Ruminococcus sp. AF14-5]|nr:hypothetical protein DWW20_20545 [Ruminococcus sp. AF14-5]
MKIRLYILDSTPRVRGKDKNKPQIKPFMRFNPASAGKSIMPPSPPPYRAIQPRKRGEKA